MRSDTHGRLSLSCRRWPRARRRRLALALVAVGLARLWPRGQLKDYIVRPKANGYRSLHILVTTHPGVQIEIQIRTAQMHELAERMRAGERLRLLCHCAPRRCHAQGIVRWLLRRARIGISR